MPLFKLNEHRFIDTDHISVIQHSNTVADPKLFQRTPSYLIIKLKSPEEEIRLEGAEADKVWAAYQKGSSEKIVG